MRIDACEASLRGMEKCSCTILCVGTRNGKCSCTILCVGTRNGKMLLYHPVCRYAEWKNVPVPSCVSVHGMEKCSCTILCVGTRNGKMFLYHPVCRYAEWKIFPYHPVCRYAEWKNVTEVRYNALNETLSCTILCIVTRNGKMLLG
ncbi:hypothetical protein SAMN05444266_111100 [Chitinophaga jiangningensis]|uniref:Uncharacterized protein n=1 Tax=Chitinophaga jiangningensis TaxID=1419482 RepID=A0A1M7LRD8_9BACT|nr:hypothetical protein SAMN05444266_111100 [Chitinophaga jiangningensis]